MLSGLARALLLLGHKQIFFRVQVLPRVLFTGFSDDCIVLFIVQFADYKAINGSSGLSTIASWHLLLLVEGKSVCGPCSRMLLFSATGYSKDSLGPILISVYFIYFHVELWLTIWLPSSPGS